VPLPLRFVDGDGIPNDAHASTIKTKLSATVLAESVVSVGFWRLKMSPLSGPRISPAHKQRRQPSRVADPTETRINQAYIRYQGPGGYGHQITVASSLPWITTVSSGHVGWRQNEQTFDAATVVNKSLADTTLTAGYIHNVNRLVSEARRRGRRSRYAERHLQRTL